MAKKNKPPNKKKDLLDLHGYTTDEVADAVDQFLSKAMRQKKKQVSIMPGKGKGKVKKELISYLKLGGFPWSYDKLPNGKSNEGCLIVFLD